MTSQWLNRNPKCSCTKILQIIAGGQNRLKTPAATPPNINYITSPQTTTTPSVVRWITAGHAICQDFNKLRYDADEPVWNLNEDVPPSYPFPTIPDPANDQSSPIMFAAR